MDREHYIEQCQILRSYYNYPGLPRLLKPGCTWNHSSLPSYLPQYCNLQTGCPSDLKSICCFLSLIHGHVFVQYYSYLQHNCKVF